MGSNTLVTKRPGDFEDANDLNQYKEALEGDNVPRGTSGVATDASGSLGSASIKWLKAKIAKGYWNTGDIKVHHSYDGVVPVDQGWYPCDGTIINETNYDLIHGSGSWVKYIESSLLDGKYSPDLINRHMVGTDSTTEDGDSAIATAGAPTIDLTHNHTNALHVHQWYKYTGVSTSSYHHFGTTYSSAPNNTGTFDSSGNQISMPANSTGDLVGNLYTNTGTISIDTTSLVKDLTPESIEATHYIRII